MSDPVPPAPSMPEPPPVMARLNPPTDVQEAIAVALRACHAWQPAVAPRPALAEGPAPILFTSTPQTVEAGVCDLIDAWPQHAEQGAMLVLSFGILLGLAAAALLLMLRRGYRAFWRTRAGWWMRDTLGEPWRDLQAAALGALLGCAAGLTVAALLLKAGLDAPVLIQALCFIGGAAGAPGMIWLRRSEWRRGGGRVLR